MKIKNDTCIPEYEYYKTKFRNQIYIPFGKTCVVHILINLCSFIAEFMISFRRLKSQEK